MPCEPIDQGAACTYSPLHVDSAAWSGEYVHAAPWRTGSQGYANVRTLGMSGTDAEWFYNTFNEGDVVKVVNSDGKTMDAFGNGFGDWKELEARQRADGRVPDARQTAPRCEAAPLGPV